MKDEIRAMLDLAHEKLRAAKLLLEQATGQVEALKHQSEGLGRERILLKR